MISPEFLDQLIKLLSIFYLQKNHMKSFETFCNDEVGILRNVWFLQVHLL